MENIPQELRDVIVNLGQQVSQAQAQALAAEQRAQAAEQRASRLEQAMASGGGASPPSRSPPGSGSQFIDTRLVSKPGEYSGPSSWQAWSFQFRNWLGAVDERLKERLDHAMSPTVQESQLANSAQTAEGKQMSRSVYMLLAGLCRGSAAARVENSGDGEGFVAWRRLYLEANPASGGHRAARMQGIMASSFRTLTLSADLEAFDTKVARYEAETREIIPTSLKTAIVTKGLDSAELQRHVILNASRLEEYETLKAELQSVVLAQVGVAAMGAAASAASTSAAAASSPTPMDIDSLVAAVLGRINHSGKGKGKGKGKTGGKDGKGGKKSDSKASGAGKGDQTASDGKKSQSERVCFKCGKPGHYKRDCPTVKKGDRLNAVGADDEEFAGDHTSLAAFASGSSWLLPFSEELGVEETPCRGLLVDSGAGRSTCPRRLLGGARVRAPAKPLALRTATGEVVTHEGDASLVVETPVGERLGVDVAVAEVAIPILSVAAMVDKGHTVVFAPSGAYVTKGDQGAPPDKPHLALRRRGGLFWLDAHAVPFPAGAEETPLCVARAEVPARVAPLGEAEVQSVADGPEAADAGSLEEATARERARGVEAAREAAKTSAEARGGSVPGAPTAAERERHCLTHVPARRWCEVCVRSKGRASAHRARAEGTPEVPELQVDYLFFPDGAGDQVTVCCLSWSLAGAVHAVVGPKGASGYVARSLVAILDVWGVRDAVMRCDQEPAVMSLCEHVRQLRGSTPTMVQHSATYSSQSLGGAERANQAVGEQCRAVLMELRARAGFVPTAPHNIIPWLVRHSSWVLTRFVTKAHGASAWEWLRGRRYDGELAMFGEVVFGRIADATDASRKMAPRWFAGVWLGKTETSDEHLLGDGKGVHRVRCVRRRVPGERFHAGALNAFHGVPWDLRAPPGSGRQELPSDRPEAEPHVGSNLGGRIPVHVGRSVPSAEATAAEQEARAEVVAGPLPGRLPYVTRALVEAHGRTLGCPRCCGSVTLPHSDVCRRRFAGISLEEERMEAARASRCAGGPGGAAPGQVAAAGSSGSAAPVVAEQGTPAGEDEPMSDGDPELKRVRISALDIIREDHVDPVPDHVFGLGAERPEAPNGTYPYVHGTVRCSRGGQVLDPARVQEARELEMAQMRRMGVVEVVPRSAAQGHKIVKCRWVDDERFGDEVRGDFVRSRCVAMEFKTWEGARDDVAANTPPLWLTRFVASLVMCTGIDEDYHIGTADVSVAFLHAAMDEVMFVVPPRGCAPDGHLWRLRKALYGTRRAGFLWGEHAAAFMTAGGWHRVRSVAGLFVRKDSFEVCLLHGDDFIYGSPLSRHSAMDQMLRANTECKILAKVGPRRPDGCARFLKRSVTYDAARDVMEIRPNPKNTGDVLRAMSLEGADLKPVETPGTKATGSGQRDAAEDLDPEESHNFLSVGGGLTYVSLDRPDLQYSAKTVMAEAAKPTRLALARLKRVARYLAGAPVLVWTFCRQPDPECVEVYADSDWVAAPGRRSRSGIAVMYGRHLLETASVTQPTVALSTGEAEVVALVRAAASAVHVRSVFHECLRDVALRLHSDSSAARGIASRNGLSSKVKHMDIKVCWLQEIIRGKHARIVRVGTEENPADLMTKWVPRATMLRHLAAMGLRLEEEAPR